MDGVLCNRDEEGRALDGRAQRRHVQLPHARLEDGEVHRVHTLASQRLAHRRGARLAAHRPYEGVALTRAGRMLALRYAWSHEGKPCEGILLLGDDVMPEEGDPRG